MGLLQNMKCLKKLLEAWLNIKKMQENQKFKNELCGSFRQKKLRKIKIYIVGKKCISVQSIEGTWGHWSMFYQATHMLRP